MADLTMKHQLLLKIESIGKGKPEENTRQIQARIWILFLLPAKYLAEYIHPNPQAMSLHILIIQMKQPITLTSLNPQLPISCQEKD